MATQEERKAETRALLLEAAADLFARKGVHAVSVDAIAEAAGRTSGALYAHFGGKDGLLVELVDHQSRRAAARISAEAHAEADLTDLLRSIWQGWAEPVRDDEESVGDEAASWSQLEHELWLEATRRSEVAERVAERFAFARRNTGEGLRAWQAQAGRTSAGEAVPSAPEGALDPDDLGTLALALLFGLEMQRRVDASAVPDDLAVRGLQAILDP